MRSLVWRRVVRALRKPWRDQLRSTLRGLQWLLAPALTQIEWGLRRWRPAAAHALRRRVVVTLTSYPERFATLALTLKCLLNQTVRPDAVILWLHEPDFASLPRSMLRLRSRGLQIRTCATDLRSYKKLVPLLLLEPEVVAFTADDDARYERHWLEELLAGHTLHPLAVQCHRAHSMRFDADGLPLRYHEWTKATEARGPQGALFFTGIGGVLFPPGVLYPDATDASKFGALCPDADDVWLNAMVRRCGAPIRRVGSNAPFLTWMGTQRRSLFRGNARGSGNDEALRRLIAGYGAEIFRDSLGVAGPSPTSAGALDTTFAHPLGATF